MNTKYYFGIGRNSTVGINAITVVPCDYWEEHHSHYPDYIDDSAMVSDIEKLGYIECAQNIFELTPDYKFEDVKDQLNNLGYLEYKQDVTKYCNKIKLPDRSKKKSEHLTGYESFFDKE